MGRRGRKAELYQAQGEPAAAREDLERRWRSRMSRDNSLSRLVTADGARVEPFHRWLPFRQGFSPGLVRLFLNDAVRPIPFNRAKPVLDPFSGTGTTVVECARAEVAAFGLDASPPLAFLINVKFEHAFPVWTPLPETDDWRAIAPLLTHPLHRAALLLAVARRHSTAGRPQPSALALTLALEETVAMMRDDLRRPLGIRNHVAVDDARAPNAIEDESLRAILTSPPYLSRYDYAEITAPLAEVHRFWYPEPLPEAAVAGQLSATTGRAPVAALDAGEKTPLFNPSCDENTDAVREISDVLRSTGERKLATVVQRYFADLRRVLRECYRRLAPGAPAWFVIGGARPKGVYVPSDLIFAGMAEQEEFAVQSILVARDLIHARRKFGSLGHVAPRESVVVVQKP